MYNKKELTKLTISELKKIAEELKIKCEKNTKKR